MWVVPEHIDPVSYCTDRTRRKSQTTPAIQWAVFIADLHGQDSVSYKKVLLETLSVQFGLYSDYNRVSTLDETF